VPSPWLIGKISDVYSLAQAVKIVPLAILVSAGIWVWAARAQRSCGDGASLEPG
jgi:hypothetical protein